MNAHQTKLSSLILIVLCTLLVCRLLLLLFAARPDNPSVALILSISTPLSWPFAWIDASQPIYGARFERGTLLGVALCLSGLYLLHKKNTLNQ